MSAKQKEEKALRLFSEGYVCSQAVLTTYAEQLGLEYKTALKISTAFGGGIARSAEVCGALTGALMVIGLMHGNNEVEDDATKERTYTITTELMQRFTKKFGSIKCNSILGEDISTEQGLQSAREKQLFQTVCPEYIRFTIETLEELL